jgi:hypothetical protein
MTKIHCWNEYDSLKTVILGSVFENDKIPSRYDDKKQEDFVSIVEQSNRELNNFQNILEQLNVKVLRPKQPLNYNCVEIINHDPLINMRDFYMVYGNMFFTTYGPYVERRYQHLWLEKICDDLLRDGNLIVNSTEVNLQEDVEINPEYILKTYDDYFKMVGIFPPKNINHAKSFVKNIKKVDPFNKLEWLIKHNISNYSKNYFHTASILKHNSKCFISKYSGTELGKIWMKNWLNFLGIELIYVDAIGHLDSEICILNSDSIISFNKENVLSNYFKKIYVPENSNEWIKTLPSSFVQEQYDPSLWLHKWQPLFKKNNKKVNCLTINPETIILPFYDRNFYSVLKNDGITAIYVEWSNDVFWEGSLHCITCDIERRVE